MRPNQNLGSYDWVVRPFVLLGFLAGCTPPSEAARAPDAEPPAPWTSGSTTHAIEWTADGLVSLAGRVVPSIGFACEYDPAQGTFVTCPASTTSLGYADTNCTTRIFADDGHAAFLGSTRFISDPANVIYSVEQSASTVTAYYDVVDGVCQHVGESQDRLVAVAQWSTTDLNLTMVAQHSFNGVDYTTLETSDGYPSWLRSRVKSRAAPT